MTDKRTDLLLKLKALADRGEAGEQSAARKKLDELMRKYGVDEADLTDEVLHPVEFRYSDAAERKILNQVFYKINHDREVFVYRNSRAKVLLWECTTAEAIRAKVEYDFFRDLWREEVGMFLSAFIQKHNIFRVDPDAPTDSVDPEKLMRMTLMMEGMQDKQVQPLLEDGDGEDGGN